MPFHDLAADREANAGSFVLAASMQALENLKNALAVFLVEPNAVVFHRDPPGGCAIGQLEGFAAYLHHRALTRLLKLQSVADQVLEQLRQLAPISENHR